MECPVGSPQANSQLRRRDRVFGTHTPTVAAVRAALHPDVDADDPPALDDSPSAATTSTGAPPIDQPADVITADHLPTGGIGLAGPGAHNAAGGRLVTAALSAVTTGRHDSHIRVVTTIADLQTLLGPGASAHHPTPGLSITNSLDDAITILEQHAASRNRAHPAP